MILFCLTLEAIGLAELFWFLVHEPQYFEIYAYDNLVKHRGLGHRVKTHYHILVRQLKLCGVFHFHLMHIFV